MLNDARNLVSLVGLSKSGYKKYCLLFEENKLSDTNIQMDCMDSKEKNDTRLGN